MIKRFTGEKNTLSISNMVMWLCVFYGGWTRSDKGNMNQKTEKEGHLAFEEMKRFLREEIK